MNEKYIRELNYWKKKYDSEGNTFYNNLYKNLFLSITGETDQIFNDKVIADFGCGPRGSLVWAENAALRIGIDVLVNDYFDCFGKTLIRHNMIYISSTEQYIPIPDAFIDIVSTINSMDHCSNFDQMISEVFRILKPGGLFIGSFNLNEPANVCEPQTLTKKIIDEIADSYLDPVLSYKIGYKSKPETYQNLFDKNYVETPEEDKPAILWIYGKKKLSVS